MTSSTFCLNASARQAVPADTSARLALATSTAKLAGWTTRHLRLGAGSTLPGTLARKINPALLHALGSQVRQWRLGVTGTNGKTTTCGLLAQALRENGHRVAHNQMGANMLPGITAALIQQASWTGRLDADMAVLEVDEASLRRLTPELAMDAIVVTNLFRDQLDRYGELDTTAQLILEGAGDQTPLILNVDDPLVAAMARNRSQTWWFGVGAVEVANETQTTADLAVPFPSEVNQCPVCGQGPLTYQAHWYGHLGHYHCPDCGYQRHTPDVEAKRVLVRPDGSEVLLSTPIGEVTLWLPLPGLFNVYNLLAATTTALLAGVPLSCLQPAIDHLPGVFGRAECLTIHGKTVRVMLIKNPVGATEVLRCVAADPTARVLVALNDQDADGRDVSWIWDAAFERLQPVNTPVFVSGMRVWDMANRLKYAGLDPQHLRVEQDLLQAVKQAVADCPPDRTLYVIPTYTALLKLRTLWDQV